MPRPKKNATESKKEEPEARTLEGWRGGALDLSLGVDDLELVDQVLCLVPELRAVTLLVQEAHRRGLSYPVYGPDQIAELVNGDSFEVAGHRVDRESITHALPQEWFPLVHEGELLSVTHLAIRRCQAELAVARMEELRSVQAAGETLTAEGSSARKGR
jgi:hypothetical protein